MTPDPEESLWKVDKNRIKAGFSECWFDDFELEVQERLGGTATSSESVLKKREEVIWFQEPKYPPVENFLEQFAKYAA